MKSISKQLIVISIILLLIGVSVSSAISVDTESTISNNEIVEDCGCNEVSATDLIKVERLLNRVEVYSKLLLVLSRDNPEIQEEIEELLDLINPDSLWDFPIICNILNRTLNKLVDIVNFFENFFENWLASTEEGTLEYRIAVLCFEIFENIFMPIFGIVFLTGIFIGCWDFPYPFWDH